MKLISRSVVHPWECDLLGHQNVRYYAAKFDDAAFLLLGEAFGCSVSAPEWQHLSFADVNHQVDYKREFLAGEFIDIYGGLIKVGRTSVVLILEMRNNANREVCATTLNTCVLFDLKNREPVKISDKLKARSASFLINGSNLN